MIKGCTMRKPRPNDRRGFSMIEATIASLLVGTLAVAALNTVGASMVSQTESVRQSNGLMLAQDLMTEILSKTYEDPDIPGEWGPGTSETLSSGRSQFDDVDDYMDWTSTPPQYGDGTKIPNHAKWKRIVRVKWIDPDTFSAVDTESGLKRIKVKVKWDKRLVCELYAIRADIETD